MDLYFEIEISPLPPANDKVVVWSEHSDSRTISPDNDAWEK